MKMNTTTIKKLAALTAAALLAICAAFAQQGWAGYTQTGHYTTTNQDGTTTDHDSGKNDNGDTIQTDTTRDKDGRAIVERTEVKDKNGKTKYIRYTKWGDPDKPWKITWGYLWNKQDGPDEEYDPKSGQWKNVDKAADGRCELKTAQGSVIVYLPTDMAAGDTISGMVVTQPAGKNDAERAKNESVLEGLVVSVGDQKTRVRDRWGLWSLPIYAPIPMLKVTLSDSKDHAVAYCSNIPYLEVIKPEGGVVSVPTIGQAGQSIDCWGRFDGDITSDIVTVGGKPVPVLAESPRSLKLMLPADAAGMNNVEIREAGSQPICAPIRLIQLSLRMDRTTMMQGETTPIVLELKGLSGLNEPVSVHLSTHSSGAAQMVGGNEQNVLIQPGEVAADGTCRRTLTITGSHAGAFTISAAVGRG
jgi:hypothetical protein